jgi:hypothetical protein
MIFPDRLVSDFEGIQRNFDAFLLVPDQRAGIVAITFVAATVAETTIDHELDKVPTVVHATIIGNPSVVIAAYTYAYDEDTAKIRLVTGGALSATFTVGWTAHG